MSSAVSPDAPSLAGPLPLVLPVWVCLGVEVEAPSQEPWGRWARRGDTLGGWTGLGRGQVAVALGLGAESSCHCPSQGAWSAVRWGGLSTALAPPGGSWLWEAESAGLPRPPPHRAAGAGGDLSSWPGQGPRFPARPQHTHKQAGSQRSLPQLLPFVLQGPCHYPTCHRPGHSPHGACSQEGACVLQSSSQTLSPVQPLLPSGGARAQQPRPPRTADRRWPGPVWGLGTPQGHTPVLGWGAS